MVRVFSAFSHLSQGPGSNRTIEKFWKVERGSGGREETFSKRFSPSPGSPWPYRVPAAVVNEKTWLQGPTAPWASRARTFQ